MTAGPAARTRIVDSAVARIAVLAASEVPGVVALRGSPADPGRGATRIPGSSTFRGPGVVCQVGPHDAAFDLALVAAAGCPLPTLTAEVRRRVVAAVDVMTGLGVVRVDVHVVDLADAEPQAPAVGMEQSPGPGGVSLVR